MKARGFTLIETLVVAVVVALLAALAIPAVAGAPKGRRTIALTPVRPGPATDRPGPNLG